MTRYYSRIPEAAVFLMFDGNVYAYVPHSIGSKGITENFTQPKLVRFDMYSFMRNGEAHVYIGQTGPSVKFAYLPFGVSIEE